MPNQKTSQTSLIYNANKGSKTKQDKRDYRYERRSNAKTISKHDRFLKCGCTSIGPVTIGLKGAIAQQRGLYTCGSVWVCPVCNAKVMTIRADEVERAISAWTLLGGYFVFETLTMSHRPGDSVVKQRKSLQAAWASINKGSFKSKHSKYGQQGYFRVAEVTSGPDGEHLHFHVLRFIEHWLPSDELQQWKDEIFNKWSASLEAQGMRKPSPSYHDFQQVEVAEDFSGYFTKNYDNPQQAVDGILNNPTSTSIWRLLDEAIANPDSEASVRWVAYEKDTLGMKQITWAQGFRKQLGIGAEQSDEEVAIQSEDFEPILQINPECVRRLGAIGRIHSRVLRQIENGDLDAALHLLDEHGIHYTLFPEYVLKDKP